MSREILTPKVAEIAAILVKMFEIKLSQGAKPEKGFACGKVTEIIASTEAFLWVKTNSPNRHPDVTDASSS